MVRADDEQEGYAGGSTNCRQSRSILRWSAGVGGGDDDEDGEHEGKRMRNHLSITAVSPLLRRTGSSKRSAKNKAGKRKRKRGGRADGGGGAAEEEEESSIDKAAVSPPRCRAGSSKHRVDEKKDEEDGYTAVHADEETGEGYGRQRRSPFHSASNFAGRDSSDHVCAQWE